MTEARIRIRKREAAMRARSRSTVDTLDATGALHNFKGICYDAADCSSKRIINKPGINPAFTPGIPTAIERVPSGLAALIKPPPAEASIFEIDEGTLPWEVFCTQSIR